MSKTYRDKARYYERMYWDYYHNQPIMVDGIPMRHFIKNRKICQYIYKNHYHYHWAQSTPSDWNNCFHTRPTRADTRRKIKKIMTGYLDADNVIFRDIKKPTLWYW